MTLSEGDKRWIRIAIKAHGLKTQGLKIALVPNDDGSIDLFAIEYRKSLATYELDEGETIQEMATALQEFLEGSEVRAPSALSKSNASPHSE
jgi:hypothetical protein